MQQNYRIKTIKYYTYTNAVNAFDRKKNNLENLKERKKNEINYG